MEESRRRFGARLRPLVARRLLLLLASVTLLGAGSPDVVHRAGAAHAAQWVRLGDAGTVVGRLGGSPAGAERQAPYGVTVLRAASATALPGPFASGDGPPPGSAPLVAPYPKAPRVRAPTTAPATRPSGPAGSRAPPATAGIDASLPLRP